MTNMSTTTRCGCGYKTTPGLACWACDTEAFNRWLYNLKKDIAIQLSNLHRIMLITSTNFPTSNHQRWNIPPGSPWLEVAAEYRAFQEASTAKAKGLPFEEVEAIARSVYASVATSPTGHTILGTSTPGV